METPNPTPSRHVASAPTVYDYLDLRRYLSDWFEWKKTSRPGWGQRRVAAVVGLAHGTINNVLKGIRLPQEATIVGLITALKLDDDEAGYFRLLVELAEAEGTDRRYPVLERLFQHPGFGRSRTLTRDLGDYLSDPVTIVVRERSLLPGFRADPAWLAAQFTWPVAPEEVHAALERLGRLGLLNPGARGDLDRVVTRLETEAGAPGEAMFQHHLAVLGLATRLLREIPPRQRYYGSGTVAVTADELAALRLRLHQVLRDTLNDLDAHEKQATHLVQIGIQLVPLAHWSADDSPVSGEAPPRR